MTDPIADMLTRLRNANMAKHQIVDIPASNIKRKLANILLQEGYVKAVENVNDGVQGIIRVTLKYGENKAKTITGLKRISKPGLRVYAGNEELPRVLKGLGIAVISTSQGIMTDRQARKLNIGGEVLCFVW